MLDEMLEIVEGLLPFGNRKLLPCAGPSVTAAEGKFDVRHLPFSGWMGRPPRGISISAAELRAHAPPRSAPRERTPRPPWDRCAPDPAGKPPGRAAVARVARCGRGAGPGRVAAPRGAGGTCRFGRRRSTSPCRGSCRGGRAPRTCSAAALVRVHAAVEVVDEDRAGDPELVPESAGSGELVRHARVGRKPFPGVSLARVHQVPAEVGVAPCELVEQRTLCGAVGSGEGAELEHEALLSPQLG
jgi:hypothetical protein